MDVVQSEIRNPKSAILLLAASILGLVPSPVVAQMDPRGRWRTWSTEHFRIHAHKEYAAIVPAAAREAERAYAVLSGELRRPRGMVDLVLYDNVDFSNGFANVYPSSRITIYLTPPAGDIGLGRYDEWLRLVITHELTHIFHLDRADGIWGGLQHVFGRASLLFPNSFRPGWVIEGLAVYYETRMTSGGRGRGAFHSQLLTAAARGGDWPQPGDANFTTGRWPGGTGPYAFGSRFFAYEAATHGDTVIPRFIDHTSARIWPFDISASLAKGGGKGLYADWAAYRKEWEGRFAGVSRGTTLVRGLRDEPRPRLSLDGRLLAYVINDGKRRERVVIRDVSNGMTVASRGVNGGPEIAWIGNDLVLAQLGYRAPVEIRSSLFRWTPGGAFRKISHTDRLLRPFSLAGGETGAILLGPAQLTVVRVLNGSGVEPLPVPLADEWSHVAASPDGRYLAGARHAGGRWDIVMWPAGSPSAVRTVTDDEALDDDPSWSSDGKRVVFTSERSGLPQIYAFDVTTGETTRLTDEPTGAREGDVAPDGTIYFSSLLSDGYAIMSSSSPLSPLPAGEGDAPSLARSDGANAELNLRATSLSPAARGDRGEEYRPWQSLAPRYWLPIAHVSGGVGSFVGATTSGSDVVGRTAYAADFAHALDNNRWEGFLGLAYSRWGALMLDASARQFWGVGGTAVLTPGTGPLTVAERSGSIVAGATLTHQWWRSLIAARLGAEMSQDAFFLPDSFNVRYGNPKFLGGVGSILLSRTDHHALSISTEDGFQLSTLYRRKWATDGSGWASELRGSVQGFLGLPLPGFSRWVLAGRVSGGLSEGPYARRFAAGGESGSTLAVIPGLGFGAGFRDFGLRGYPPGGSQFTRVVASAAELRIPLFLIGRGVWRLPLALDRVSITGFGETGGGWMAGGPVQPTQFRDIGAELVVDLGLNLDIPLRGRIGAAEALTAGLGARQGAWRWYAALGSSF